MTHPLQLENAVFLKLKKAGRKIYFGALNGKEIDFITQDRQNVFEKYQVAQTLHNDNTDRELSPFVMKNTHLAKGSNILLTLDEHEETVEYKASKIFKHNIIKWLLNLARLLEGENYGGRTIFI